MLLRIEADQAAAHQRAVLQVERLLGVEGDLALQFDVVGGSDFDQRGVHLRVDVLQHLLFIEDERGAQHLMTLHQ
ncbi:hypothetical protein D3C75_1206760 [compost metagenome]